MKSKWLLAFLSLVFLKQLIWALIIPLWHFPDEAAHFAQVQNLAEKKKGNASQEISQSEAILQVLRDEKGNNSYTFHPDFNLTYSATNLGLNEEEVNNLPTTLRFQSSNSPATSYPPLYYWLGAGVYRIFYSQNLIIRVFSVRVLSCLLTTLLAYFVFKIGQLLFKKDPLALFLGILVSFQPMLSFVGSGVSSDVLFNLIFTIFIFKLLQIFLSSKTTLCSWLTLLSVFILGLLTKPQMVIALPTCLIVLPQFIRWFKSQATRLKILEIGLSIILLYLAYLFGETSRIYGFLFASTTSYHPLNFFSHLVWTIRHTIAEVLPWYWGVFKWLGVVLPSWVRQVQMRLLILALIPLYALFKNKDKKILFLYFVSLVYFLGLTLWDYFFRLRYNFSFGIQGRYYFPVIVCHLALILAGIQILPSFFKRLFTVLLPFWWLILHTIGLFTVIKAYYNVTNLKLFILQVSQYKPALIKGWPLEMLLIIFVAYQLIFFCLYGFRLAKKTSK